MQLIDEAKHWWRMSSTWASGSAVGILSIWNMMPNDVHGRIPAWVTLPIGFGLWGVIMLARLWKQPKLEARISGGK